MTGRARESSLSEISEPAAAALQRRGLFLQAGTVVPVVWPGLAGALNPAAAGDFV